MNKKKIVALLVAGIMTIGVVGGTLAWFTSNDSVTNVFNTGTTTEDRLDAGIDVWEKFYKDGEEETSPTTETEVKYDNPVLPGDKFVKEIWVQSTANYDQFLRAKLVKSWKINKEQEEYWYSNETDNGITAIQVPSLRVGDIITHYIEVDGKVLYANFTGVSSEVIPAGWNAIDYEKIGLEVDNIGSSGDTWSDLKDDGYYYYNQKLALTPTKTSNLLKSVTFISDENDNYYKNLTFDVKLEAESVQASNGAAADLDWNTTVPVAKANTEAYGTKVTP